MKDFLTRFKASVYDIFVERYHKSGHVKKTAKLKGLLEIGEIN